MKEHPILFSGPMVKAILEGRKTQTRRVVKPQPSVPYLWHTCADGVQFWTDNETQGEKGKLETRNVPYGVRGDRLWVRETWAHDDMDCKDRKCGNPDHIWFHADETKIVADSFAGSAHWRPSIFMPRWASRITLEIVNVRVERVQEITEADAKAEGIDLDGLDHDIRLVKQHLVKGSLAIDRYARLWNSINDKDGKRWNDNPFVWVIEFNINMLERE